jgi:hypothetical protein
VSAPDDHALVMEIVKVLFCPAAKFHSEKEKVQKLRAGAVFTIAAGELLSFIGQAQIPEAERKKLRGHFLSACMACRTEARLRYDTVERLEGLRDQHYTQKRIVKRAQRRSRDIATRDDIIRACAAKAWAKKKKLRESAQETAKAIHTPVNRALRRRKLKGLRPETLRKLIKIAGKHSL